MEKGLIEKENKVAENYLGTREMVLQRLKENGCSIGFFHWYSNGISYD